MLDDEGDDFHPTRERYSHLSQIEWEAVERLSSTIGQEAVGALLSALGPDGLLATIAKSIQNELDVEREKVTLLHQQGSQQTELLRQQQATATGSTCIRGPETLKIDILKYKGADEDSLLRWFVEMDDAIRARHIVDEEMQIAFAQLNLARRGPWALSYTNHMSLGRWKSSSPC